MDVKSAVEPLRSDPKLLRVRTHVGQGDLGGLLHDVPQLPGQREPGLAVAVALRHRGGLDEEDVAAGARDGEPGGHARHGCAVGRLEPELLPAEVGSNVGGVDHHRSRLNMSLILSLALRGDLGRHLAK